MQIAADLLERFSADLLNAGGFHPDEAARTARSLVRSNLLGYDSHGVVRVPEYLAALRDGTVVSGASLNVLRKSPNSLWADAGLGLGQVQMPRLIDQLLRIRAEQGPTGSIVGAMRHCGHVGRLGEWVEQLAREGLVAFLAVNDNGTIQSVAPPGGKVARTSTNPIAFAIPLESDEPFVLDISTSAVSMGKIRVALLSGEPAPEGALQDASGCSTRDPSALFGGGGALRSMGDYKGFGLSMVIDCLVAGLSGGFAPPAPAGEPVCNNVVLTAWDPALLGGLARLKTLASRYLEYIRETPPTHVEAPVRVAGDRSKREASRRAQQGITMSEGLRTLLRDEAQRVGLAVPAFL